MNKSILQRCVLLIVMLMATMAASADRIYFNPDVIKIDPYTYNPEWHRDYDSSRKLATDLRLSVELESGLAMHIC